MHKLISITSLIQTTSAASANVVDIEVRSNHDYLGPLFIGSDFAEARVIYDTMSDWSVILNDDTQNAIISGNYRYQDSTTAQAVKNMTKDEIASVNQGSYEFIGKKYTDQICLSQVTNERTWETGKMCVQNMEFVATEEVIGEFTANGVLGLAPTKKGQQSFIDQLQVQGVIDHRIVGLNFENPLDTDQASKISIGQIDYNEVENGIKGLNFYTNRAVDKWGLQMDDFLYNDIDMTANSGAKIGLIDSGNTSIQVPETIFKNIMKKMQGDERSIYSSKIDGKTILVARKSCDELETKLKDIEFVL